MSRKQRQAPPEGGAGETGRSAPADAAQRLLAWADQALSALAAHDTAALSDDERYARGFALGEALGRRLRGRCAGHAPPQGLGLLVGFLSAPGSPEREAARRAMLAGLCWDLETTLCDSARQPAAVQPTA